ncbi:unnamed protein product [Rotaria sp. Silwood1]|nr:unnamed protein product [Rotaria sp. Silwood1]
MTYQLKKEYLTNWDAPKSNEKSIFSDDQDTYISEKSSIISLRENNQPSIPNNKELLTPPVLRTGLPKKQPHTLRYPYNDLPKNGIPLATQYNNAQKEEKKRKKAVRKAPPGQGNLVSLPENNPSAMNDNYYPYWHYYKLKNPDWSMRHRQTTDGQLIPYDPVDPSKYVHESALTKSPTTPHRHHRKSHHNNHDTSIAKYNSDKHRYETVQKVSQSSPPISYKNYREQRSPPKQNTSLEDANNIERLDRPIRQRSSQHRHKPTSENNLNDYSVTSMTEKPLRDSNNLTVPSDASVHRSKHRSKKKSNDSTDENKTHHHSHHHHHHHHSPVLSQQQHHHHHHHSPTQSQQHHHQHHHRHNHHHHTHPHFSPSKEYVDTEFQVIDASFAKSERTPFFQGTENSFHSPPPSIYNQSSYLPPITSDHHNGSNSTDYHTIHTLSNAITAGIALVVEIAFLTIRWIVYLCVKKNEEKLKDYLVAGCAIDTKEYVKCLIQAGIANGVSFGMSIAGGVVGTFIPLPGATVGFSILFGFISYVIARWGSGALINIFQKLIDEKMNE